MGDHPEDRQICEAILQAARQGEEAAFPFPALVAAVGRRFLGAPYEAGTLGCEAGEPLRVNLRRFDCVTLVESVLALARTIRAGQTAFEAFLAALTLIRYRQGCRDGYASRLHYFTDWLQDNARRGTVRNLTPPLGGIPFRKAIHALSRRREECPALADPEVYRRLRAVEGACSRRLIRHIPKADLERTEAGIDEGDIVAITTDEPGLDVSHVGLAVRSGRRLHLLHASSAAGRVLISEVTLGRYLTARRSRAGLMVARPLPPP